MDGQNTPKTLKQILDEKLWWKHRYEALKGVPEAEEQNVSGEQERNPGRTSRQRFISVAVTILLLIIAGTWLSIAAINKRGSPIDQCGTTPEEARARGCFFEMTLSLWVPEECYDRELEAEYLSDPDLVYYRDIHFTQVVPFDEVKRGEVYAWFVPWEHHIRHCSFALKKFHRAAARGGKLDGYVLNYNHTLHCIDMMTEPPEQLVKLPQRDVRMYPYCGRRGGYNVDKTRRFQWTE